MAVPWWVSVAAACLLTNVAEERGRSTQSEGRRLGEFMHVPQPPMHILHENKTTLLEFEIPCYLMIHPCGEVRIPPEGLNFSFPFGSWYAMGSDSVVSTIRQTEHAFSQYTLYFALATAAVFLYQDIRSGMQERPGVEEAKAKKQLGPRSRSDLKLKYGLVELSDSEDEEHIAEERTSRLDINAADYLAKGNIYRVLAALHPIPLVRTNFTTTPKSLMSTSRWTGLVGKSIICAFMQLYLPWRILCGVYAEWQWDGTKSPLWFMANAYLFTTMFASLASLCNIFRCKAEKQVVEDSEANYFLLVHRRPFTERERIVIERFQRDHPTALELDRDALVKMKMEIEPEPGQEAAGAPKRGSMFSQLFAAVSYWAKQQFCGCPCQRQLRPDGYENVHTPEELAAIEFNTLLDKNADAVKLVIRINELFWCFFSMFMNVAMSFLLQLCMFSKIATYTGRMEDVALVAMSLYFILDLQTKIFEDDPKLRKRYRSATRTQVIMRHPGFPERATLYFAGTFLWVSRFLTPLGLFGIAVCAWKHRETGFVIGGSGFD